MVRVQGEEVLTASLTQLRSRARETGKTVRETAVGSLNLGVWPVSLSRNAPLFTAPEQARLLSARAAVAGCGGLGGFLASLLARAGVGALTLVDGDVFDEGNLNRQAFCFRDSLGREKALEAARACQAVHPFTEAAAVRTVLTPDNALDVLKGADIVLDGLDSVPARFAVHRAARELGAPFIHGAVLGWSGQTATFLPGSSIGLDAVYPVPEDAPDPPGVLAPAVAVVAALQCQEALRILAGRPAANADRLVFFDGESHTLHRMELAPAGARS
jgi:molybdopterin/thiamine biosynthesis adenylyltransferase